MKKIILIFTIILTVKSKAQTPVIDLQTWNGDIISGMYIKDVNNVLNQFEGTWLYTNGTTSLKIVLVKKHMKLLATYYQDLIIGEYQYIENGIEKFNSLAELNTIFPNEYYHKIVGNHIETYPSPFDTTTPGEVRLKLMFKDNLGGTLLIRRKMVGLAPAIEILKVCRQTGLKYGEARIIPIVPGGVHVLLKQP